MTTTITPWGFYGRQQELAQLRGILSRNRWFFVQVVVRKAGLEYYAIGR